MVISEVQNHKERIEELYPAHKCGIVYIYMCNKIVLIRTFYFHIKAHCYKGNHSQSLIYMTDM